MRYACKHAFWTMTNRWPVVDRAILEPAGSPYCVSGAPRGTDFAYPGRGGHAAPDRLTSCLCQASHLSCPAFRYWIEQIREAPRLHRKLWEFAYVMQALYERGKLAAGRRGLAFAVGMEPLPSLFASLGCEIVATDLPRDDRRSATWEKVGGHSSAVAPLNQWGLCGAEQFERLVSFRPVDMNAIPADLTGFDFVWSTCSFEHCGSIELGLRFLDRQMRCLQPGGVAVHTTEFNLTSNRRTRTRGNTVLFRRCDIEAIVRQLIEEGHHVELLDLDPGPGEGDLEYDRLPYSYDRHLKLEWRSYVTTSLGLIMQRGPLG
jgi:hypothetical protein